MSETRRQYLERVSRVHDEWVKKYQDQVPLNPDAPPGSDYNEWIVDMDASPEAQSEFMRATAPPPEGFAPEPDDEVPMSDPYTEAKIARASMCRAVRGVADALLDHSMTVEEAEEHSVSPSASSRSGGRIRAMNSTQPKCLNPTHLMNSAFSIRQTTNSCFLRLPTQVIWRACGSWLSMTLKTTALDGESTCGLANLSQKLISWNYPFTVRVQKCTPLVTAWGVVHGWWRRTGA